MAGNAASARKVIEQIWYRARINAFAQRGAHEECAAKAAKYFRFEMVFSLVAVLFVILVYLLLTEIKAPGLLLRGAVLLLTVGSVSCTLAALFCSIMVNYLKLEVKAARHEQLQNSYQYIAQRAREVKWVDMPHEEVIALLQDLERDFSLLKATGAEPADRHFDGAHAVIKKIRSEKQANIAQSFPISDVADARNVGSGVESTAASANQSDEEVPDEVSPA